MEADEAGLSSTASFLAEDDGGVICAAVHAHMGMLFLLRRRSRSGRANRRRRYRGSVAGRLPNKQRDFAAGLFNIQRDYFGVHAGAPIYDDRDFETRFRVPRSVFRRVYRAVKDEPFFQQRISATGRLQAHPLQKVVAAFRVIAYGEAADLADEYVRLSLSTVAQATKLLLEFIVRRWGPTYLRRPNNFGAEADDGAQCRAWLSWMHGLAGLHALGVASVPDGHGGRVSEPEGLARRCCRGRLR